jgi:hypothetical protein
MSTAAFDALETALAETTITYDGLRAEVGEDGYRLETPEGRVVTDQLDAEALAEVSPWVQNWWYWQRACGVQAPAGRRYLRMLERAETTTVPERMASLQEGITTEWGELTLMASVDEDGRRRYAVRHTDDVNVAALEQLETPEEARALATFDADGRYRPLKSAPTLRRGWSFNEVAAHDLVAVIGYLYPASIPNWDREQAGALDVTHWQATAERQTGIYGIIDELDLAAVERIAATCCVDEECLKRREWEYDAETPLAADGGTGAFPCREPCSLVVAAARKWTTLERESTETYQIELTPSEASQLSAIIDAVADGATSAIREADVGEGANRYRARYLREKLFDEEGALRMRPRRGVLRRMLRRLI